MSLSMSPSSRRAWIEIPHKKSLKYSSSVALLAEGVDRNCKMLALVVQPVSRPPRGGRG